jgi:hypothetical protein
MFNASFNTTALANNNTKPPHMNIIISKPGVLSLKPVSKAIRLGMVAQ